MRVIFTHEGMLVSAGGWGSQKGLRTTTLFMAFFLRLQVQLYLLFVVVCTLPQFQKDSLLALYDSTGGPFWATNTNWNTATDPCTAAWFGVSCDDSNTNVKALRLSFNNLTGSLPDLQLPALTIL